MGQVVQCLDAHPPRRRLDLRVAGRCFDRPDVESFPPGRAVVFLRLGTSRASRRAHHPVPVTRGKKFARAVGSFTHHTARTNRAIRSVQLAPDVVLWQSIRSILRSWRLPRSAQDEDNFFRFQRWYSAWCTREDSGVSANISKGKSGLAPVNHRDEPVQLAQVCVYPCDFFFWILVLVRVHVV